MTLGFLILPLIWFLIDPRSLREKIEHYFKPKSVLFILGQIFFLTATLFSARYFSLPNTTFDNVIFGMGLFLYYSGIFLSVWAKVEMKANWGLPGEHNIKRQSKVIKKGPFALCRNPIYLGLILLILGYALVLRSYTVMIVPFVAFYFYRIVLKEEKILSKYFGKDYLEYKSRVPRFF